MKKFLIALTVSAMLMIAPGCALLENETAQKAVIVATNVPTVIADIDEVVVSLTALQKEKIVFSEDEIEKLVDALDMYEIVKMQYDVLNNLGQVPSVEDSAMIWSNAKEVYLSAMTIVKSHMDQYDKKTVYNIELLNIHAKSLDISVNELLKDPTAQNINRIMTMAGTMISVGAKVAMLL